MKKLIFLTSIGLLSYAFVIAQPNVFDPADPMVNFSNSAPLGSAQHPVTNWGNVQKWVVTPRFSWDSARFKSYHFNGVSFRIMFPKSYQHNVNDGKKYPVMLFWHGAGESGSIYDNELQLLHGGELFKNRVNSFQFDGFLVYPQNTGGSFGDSYYAPTFMVIDSLAKYCKLDVDRVFIDGLSAGGQACFELLLLYPKRVAKAAPSSAASTGALGGLNGFIHIPIWMATGALDNNPHPLVAQQVYETIRNAGGDVKWTLYPGLGHGIWYNHWQEPGFVAYMNDVHKANPLIYFQHNQFCPDSAVDARLGITAGFAAYEWRKDGVIIPGATSNEYIATSFGTYSVHFKRTPTSEWSDWSPKPAVISQKATSTTPDIQVQGLRSVVLPAPDGSTTVPLKEPTGYVNYEWYRISDNALVGTDSIFNAPVGQYRARIKEQFGCNAFFSDTFSVVNANGPNKPFPAKNLTAFAMSPTTMQLDWTDNPAPAFNETNFEIYRADAATGPFKLIGLTGANAVSFLDIGLTANTTYYYLVRAVNSFSAATNSNTALGTTSVDKQAPTTPNNLKVIGVTRFTCHLQWDPSTDNVGLDAYDVYINGVKTFSTDNTKFIATGLDSFQNYNFTVRARDLAGNLSPFSNQVTAFTKLQGLIYQYYEGDWDQLPDFNSLPILKTGMSAQPDIGVRNRNDQFGFLWQGYIKIPTTGNYVFEICSDDGSEFFFNQYYVSDVNTVATISNDGLHGDQCRNISMTNLAAGIYPIAATFFEQGGGESFRLNWDPPGSGAALIPASAFSDANTPPGTAPAAPSNLNAVAGGFDRINLSWTDNSSNETGFELLRSISQTGPFVGIFTTGAGVTSYIDSGLNASTSYHYKVRAVGAAGESPYVFAYSDANWRLNNDFSDANGNASRSLAGTATSFNASDKQEGSHSLSLPNTAPPGNGFATVNNSTGGGFPSNGGITQRTVAMWIKPTITTLKRILFDFGGADNGLGLRINANTLQAGVANNNTRVNISSGSFTNTTTWTHVAVVYSGNTLRLYINGVQAASTTSLSFSSIAASSSSSSRLGYPSGSPASDNVFAETQSTYTNYSGLMDNVYVIDGALSAADIVNLMNTNNLAGNSRATTLALPVAPTAPSAMGATAISSSAININWNDNSSDESGFEIWRSAGDEAHYRLLNTVPAGSTSPRTYSDEGLFANVTYYYKVRAKGIGGSSAFSNSANARTLNTKTVLLEVSDFTMHFDTRDTLEISAIDVDGDALTFTTNNLPPFATLVNVNNEVAQIIFNPEFNDQGSYVMSVYVNDGNGGKDTTTFNMIVDENFPPTLQPINNVIINEGADTTFNLLAGDVEDPSFINWSFSGLPAFAAFTHNGMGTGQLHLTPGFAQSGIYNVSLLVDDGFGAWVRRSFTITVNEKDPNERILVKIKYNTNGPAPWNNMTSQFVSNLKNTNGVTTTVGANVVNSWQFNLGEFGAQTGDNSGVYPDAVMKDFSWWGLFQGNNLSDTATLRITGLNPAKKYNLRLFGSSVFGGFPSSTTTYISGAQSGTLEAQNNTTETVRLNQLTPDGSGVILVTMIGDAAFDRGGFLNAFEIETLYDDGTIPVPPIDLTGDFVEHTGTQLNWTDVAYNETTYKIYRSTSPTGPYTLLNPGALNNNTTDYLDATANPLTQYYYYVVAGNGNGNSPSSDTISVLIGNNSPVISNLENLLVKTAGTATENFTVTDNAGDVLTVTSPNLPAFATLQNMGGGNYRVVANPTKDNLGRFDVTINAADDKGGLTTKTFLMNVVDRSTRSFYIKVGTDGTFGGTPWNDFLGFPFDGKSQANLKDEAGVVSTIGITYRDSWGGTNPLGFITGNNSGVYPDSVLRSYVLATDNVGKRIKFTGLNPTKRYNVVFMGSANDGLTAVANYSAPGATTVSLNARYNSRQTAQLNRLAPVGDSLIVTATKQASSTFMYLSAIVLEEITDTFTNTILLNPINLYAEPRDKSSVILTWADRSYNETGFEIQRGPSATGPWTTIQTTGANVTTFTNTLLSTNTKYFYQVRARFNTTGASEFSNVASTITPKTQVFVNLDFTFPGPYPWNNLNANPNAGLSFPNFFSDQNLTTGINLTITKQFNGQFNAGMQTFASGGIFPDNVMRSNYWTDQSQQSQFKISGLNQSKRYRFGFFGSTGPEWFDGNYTATYNIGNRTVYLNAHRNDSKVVYIGDVVPDVNGEVFLNVSTTNISDNGFTAALVINSYDDAVGGVVQNRIITSGSGVASGNDQPTNERISDANRGAQQPIASKINVYPNPFTDQLNLEFNNNAAGNKVVVDLYDMSGRLVFRRDVGHRSVGHNRLNLNLQENGFAPGVYLLKLTVNGQTLSTAKLIKNRK